MRLLQTAVIAAFVLGCASPDEEQVDTSRALSDARELYAAYATALEAHRRDTIAHFYHPDGALVVVNGSQTRSTNAGIDSLYRGPWQGPAFFAFDSLQFDAIGPASVAVSGGFRWLPQQSPDTLRFIYFALLERTASGLRIRVEHETERPRPPR